MYEPNADAALDKGSVLEAASSPELSRVPAASIADQLPTVRMPSIVPELPPLVPPPMMGSAPGGNGQAGNGQGGKMPRPSSAGFVPPPLPRGATIPPAPRMPSHVGYTEVKPRWWQALLSQFPRATPRGANAEERQRRAWTRQRIGIVCGLLGLTIIVGSIAAAYAGLGAAHLDNAGQASLAVAIVLARVAIAIAAMGVGYAMLRMAERLSFPIIVTRRSEPVKTLREP